MDNQSCTNEKLQHGPRENSSIEQRGRVSRRYSGGTVALEWIDRSKTPEELDHAGDQERDGESDDQSGDAASYHDTHRRPEFCCWQKTPGSAPCPLHDANKLRGTSNGETTTCYRRTYARNLHSSIHDREVTGHVDMTHSQHTCSSGLCESLMIERRAPSPPSLLVDTPLARRPSSASLSGASTPSTGPRHRSDHNEPQPLLGIRGPRHETLQHSAVTDSPEWGTGNTSDSLLFLGGGGIPSTMTQSQILGEPMSWDNPVHVDTSPRGGEQSIDSSWEEDLWPELGSFGALRGPPATVEGWLRGRGWSSESGSVAWSERGREKEREWSDGSGVNDWEGEGERAGDHGWVRHDA